MSGIMGIFYLDGRPVESENLGRMVDTLAHRGPDGADIWTEGSIGFGHRMLWTTPESLLERLPLVNQTGDLVITADARIDNRDELIPALGFNDRPAEKITDSQLILAAYEKWGESCPEHLLGDFAFAIWDGRKQILFCARDHFGVRPFYYYHCPNRFFAFASEIKPLLCLPEVPRHLNSKRVAGSLRGMVDHTNTFYLDILRLSAAHTMKVSQAGLEVQQYWSLDPSRELRLGSDEEYAEEFRKIFTEAVRCRLRSAFPIGSHLSGGLDSSSVTCVARDLLLKTKGTPLHTFSNIYDDVPQCDERPYINAVLAQGNLNPHYVHADQVGPLALLQDMFKHEDEGFYDPNHRLIWRLNQAAQQENVRIVLNGFDGDTNVSHGLLYLTELASKGQWAGFAREAEAIEKKIGHSHASRLQLFYVYGVPYLRQLVRRGQWISFVKEVNTLRKYFPVSRRKLFVQYGLKPLVPNSLQQVLQKLRGVQQGNVSIEQLLTSSFAQRIGLKEKACKQFESKPPMTVREDQWRLVTSGLRTFTLELLDRTAAFFSLEARHPFMDKRLIEFCLALPPEQKLHQGWNRMVMRRAMTDILPEKVQWRPSKTNMTPNFLHGLLVLDQARLDEIVLNNSEHIEEYVDINTLRMVCRQLTERDRVNPDDALAVWKAVTIALWLRHTGLSPVELVNKEV